MFLSHAFHYIFTNCNNNFIMMHSISLVQCSIVVTVKDALCLGVALDGCGNKETRPKILTWKESQEDGE